MQKLMVLENIGFLGTNENRTKLLYGRIPALTRFFIILLRFHEINDLFGSMEKEFYNQLSKRIDKKKHFNPHTPNRFTPSHARCTENCGSALTHC